MKRISFVVLLFFVVVINSYAVNMCGKTYPIIEPDLLTQMHKRGEYLLHHKKELFAMQKKIENKVKHFTPSYLSKAYLPPSKKSYTYLHDVVYVLPFDIPKVVNGKTVGILYPKGFTFHVLRYIPYEMPTIIVFDIKNKLQREYVAKKYGKDFTNKLISVTGDMLDILKMAKQLKRPVFFNLPRINQRFGLKNTISVIRKSDKYIDDVVVKVIGMKDVKKYLERKH